METAFPAPSVPFKLTETPSIPASPPSCIPFLLQSKKAKSPTTVPNPIIPASISMLGMPLSILIPLTSPKDAGSDDALDSDGDVVTGNTDAFILQSAETNTTIDIGFMDEVAPVIGPSAGNLTVECDGTSNNTDLNNWLAAIGGAAATDNVTAIGNLTWTNDFTGLSNDCGETGSTTVTFTVLDECGNTSITSAIFTIEDTTPPSIDTPASDTTIDCSTANQDAAILAWLNNNGGGVASDICGGVSWTNDYTNNLSDECGATGSVLVTFVATDACGLSSSTSATVTVGDSAPPTITTTSSDLTVECDGSGNVADINAWLASNGGAAVTDDCSTVTWTNDFSGLSDDCGETGTATVTFTATDDCGNSTTTSANIFVIDTNTPSIVTPASDLNIECDAANQDALILNWLNINGGAVASDICSGVTWTNDYLPGDLSDDCGETGTATVTFTATDDCGNSTSASADIFVIDTNAPSIDTPASDLNIECDVANQDAIILNWLTNNGGAIASDICSGVTWTNDYSNNLSDDCGATGSVLVTFVATDACGLSNSTSATITVGDSTPPIITTISSDLTVECDGGGNVADINAWLASNGGAVVTDDCSTVTWTNDFSTLSDDCGETGTATVTFIATDDCGNSTTTSADIFVIDTNAPSIDTPASDLNIECDVANQDALILNWLTNNGSAIASDSCSGVTWTHDYSNNLSNECGATGSVLVTFVATDDCGLSSSTSATITVGDSTPPTIITTSSDLTVECDGGGNVADINAWLASNGGAAATDDCSTVTWTNDFSGVSDDCGETGTATVTFTATDDCGNSTTTSADIFVIDTNAPSIDTPASDLNLECDVANQDAIILNWLNNNGGAIASDICSGVTWTNDYSNNLSDECGATGIVLVTFVAADDCGLSNSTSATITVGDSTPPIITTISSDLTVECDGGGNVADINAWLASNGGAVVTDDCSTVTWTNDFTTLSDDCGATGTLLVTFTATDDCGNSITASGTIFIIDTTPPTIDVPAQDNTIECDVVNQAIVLQNWLNTNGGASASDICGGVTWSNDYQPANLSDECGAGGQVTVTFTATDECGNSSPTTATFTIQDSTVPEITIEASDLTVECDGAGNVAELNNWLNSNTGAVASDDCSDVEWSNDFTGLSDDCGATGFAQVTFTAADSCGNSASTIATFIILDNTVPVITQEAQDEVVECDGAGNLVALNNWLVINGGATATDICSGVSWTNDYNNSGVPLLPNCLNDTTGILNVTFTATDDCGNDNATAARFIIIDQMAPVLANLPIDITYL